MIVIAEEVGSKLRDVAITGLGLTVEMVSLCWFKVGRKGNRGKPWGRVIRGCSNVLLVGRRLGLDLLDLDHVKIVRLEVLNDLTESCEGGHQSEDDE